MDRVLRCHRFVVVYGENEAVPEYVRCLVCLTKYTVEISGATLARMHCIKIHERSAATAAEIKENLMITDEMKKMAERAGVQPDGAHSGVCVSLPGPAYEFFAPGRMTVLGVKKTPCNAMAQKIIDLALEEQILIIDDDALPVPRDEAIEKLASQVVASGAAVLVLCRLRRACTGKPTIADFPSMTICMLAENVYAEYEGELVTLKSRSYNNAPPSPAQISMSNQSPIRVACVGRQVSITFDAALVLDLIDYGLDDLAIPDFDQFAEALAAQLRVEDIDGASLVHCMLDSAVLILLGASIFDHATTSRPEER